MLVFRVTDYYNFVVVVVSLTGILLGNLAGQVRLGKEGLRNSGECVPFCLLLDPRQVRPKKY